MNPAIGILLNQVSSATIGFPIILTTLSKLTYILTLGSHVDEAGTNSDFHSVSPPLVIIDGYHYNPADGKWYEQAPNPQTGWGAPAPEEKQTQLTKTRKEILDWRKSLKNPIEDAKQKYDDALRISSPLTLDLNGDGVQTVDHESGAYFDHDGDGFAEQTGWASREDGLLVRDLDGNGQIDTGRELFGDHTRLADGTDAANGFAALAELDSNQDGKIDAADSAFSTLQVWQDTNGDGLSGADELHNLTEVGVQSIATGYTWDPTAPYAVNLATDAQGNEHRQIGTFTTTTGETRAAEDIWFQVDKTYTIATEWLDVPADIAALPDLAGYGNVYGLHQAIEKRWGSDEACNECWANHAERVAA